MFTDLLRNIIKNDSQKIWMNKFSNSVSFLAKQAFFIFKIQAIKSKARFKFGTKNTGTTL